MEQLFSAIAKNDITTVDSLIKSGVNINARDRMGRTPLMYAIIDGTGAIFDLILAQPGVNIDHQDTNGDSALHFSAQCYKNHEAQSIIRAGGAIDLVDKYGNSPLWRAVFNSKGRGDLIVTLLAAGADANRKNKNGKSPIEAARSIANYDITQFFQGL